MIDRGGGAVGKSVCLAGGRIGVRIQAATDLVVKLDCDSSIAKRSAIESNQILYAIA